MNSYWLTYLSGQPSPCFMVSSKFSMTDRGFLSPWPTALILGSWKWRGVCAEAGASSAAFSGSSSRAFRDASAAWTDSALTFSRSSPEMICLALCAADAASAV